MRIEGTPAPDPKERPSGRRVDPPAVSPLGTLLVAGFNPSVRVERGALALRLGPGREARIARVNRPPLRRLVIYGSAGWWSFEVPAWLAAVGASWAHISRKGTVLGTGPAAISPDLPLLRRAQAMCSEDPVGLRIAQTLIGDKLAGQRGLVAERFPDRDDVLAALDEARSRVAKATSPDALRQVEADGAAAYWSAWSAVRVSFPRSEAALVPASWHGFDGRSSPLTSSNRGATTPLNSLLNLAYSLLLVETTVAMRLAGLDPSLPVGMHAPQRNRANGALDAMEPARVAADAIVLDLIAAGPLPRRSFIEQPNGTLQIASALVCRLLDAMPTLAQAVAPHVEGIAVTLAEAGGAGPVPTKLTQSNRSRGRDGVRKARKPPTTTARMRKSLLPRVCQTCGTPLQDTGRRTFCDACLPAHIEEVKATAGAAISRAGKATLAAMRSSPSDPARTPEALAKLAASQSRRNRERREWEAAHPERPDPEWFGREILPGLQDVSVTAIARATGLSLAHAQRIKKGTVVPHRMHWKSLRGLSKN